MGSKTLASGVTTVRSFPAIAGEIITSNRIGVTKLL